jgi:hypothetical protein
LYNFFLSINEDISYDSYGLDFSISAPENLPTHVHGILAPEEFL